MSVKFKCNQSGNIFEFFTEHDIKTMREHSEYTEVKEEPIEAVAVPHKVLEENKQPPQKRSYNKANKEE